MKENIIMPIVTSERSILPEGGVKIVINVTEWLESTKKNDVSIEKCEDGKWVFDRFMRTCTINTGIQELLTYRRLYNDSRIRLFSDLGTSLDIHFPGQDVIWV